MNEQHDRALAQGMRALAEATRGAEAGPHVEAAVLAAMRGSPGSTGRLATTSPGGRWFAAAAAAALVIASLSGAWVASRVEPRGPALIRPVGFVEIPGAAFLPPIESGSIIRVAVPVGALPQYGVAIPGDVSSGQVDADFLVAQDGVPRAIRLVRDDSMRSSAP